MQSFHVRLQHLEQPSNSTWWCGLLPVISRVLMARTRMQGHANDMHESKADMALINYAHRILSRNAMQCTEA